MVAPTGFEPAHARISQSAWVQRLCCREGFASRQVHPVTLSGFPSAEYVRVL